MKARSVFLLIIILTTAPCFGDLLILSESSLATNLDEEAALEPKLGVMLGWDTYSFISESLSLFLDSLGQIHYNTASDLLEGEIYAAVDFSYRADYFLARLGIESTFLAETNKKIYFNVVPELYLSFGSLEYTVFTSHTVSYLPAKSSLEFYEARVGLAFGVDNLLNRPIVGVGVDLASGDYPFYLIAEYELSWYPDPLLSFEFTGGVNWFLTEDEYQRYFLELEMLWYFNDGLILTVGVLGDVLHSAIESEPEFVLEPEVELGIALTESSILSLGMEGTVYIMKSYLDDPSLLVFRVQFSYLF
ncbi:MAG: hypothetical protein JW822_06480 [Spirochaetales bacterium]|nr:hypothetical protein [Spirochaetales bacterium]